VFFALDRIPDLERNDFILVACFKVEVALMAGNDIAAANDREAGLLREACMPWRSLDRELMRRGFIGQHPLPWSQRRSSSYFVGPIERRHWIKRVSHDFNSTFPRTHPPA
jgi:hypothetical protein